MTLYIILSISEDNTGPFNLYSDATGYLAAIASDVSKETLTAGLSIPDAPNGTTIVRVKSLSLCRNTVDFSVEVPVLTITTTSSTSSTSSTTTTTTTQPVLTLRL